MTFQPVVPLGGFAGWSFLTRTREAQQEALNASPAIQRNVDYFRETIASVQSAEALVNDRRLLEVALGAFGLGEDINNKFFIQKVLEDGTINPEALANRLSDKRYEDFSRAFGFGDLGIGNTTLSDFPDRIITRFQTQAFEIGVGEVNNDMRLALSLDRALAEIVEDDTTDDGRWFQIMGQPPVRQVFETALGLPSSFGSLDLEQQLSGFRDKLRDRFGDSEIAQFSDPEKVEELIRLFLARSEINASLAAGGATSAALTLLQNAAAASPFQPIT